MFNECLQLIYFNSESIPRCHVSKDVIWSTRGLAQSPSLAPQLERELHGILMRRTVCRHAQQGLIPSTSQHCCTCSWLHAETPESISMTLSGSPDCFCSCLWQHPVMKLKGFLLLWVRSSIQFVSGSLTWVNQEGFVWQMNHFHSIQIQENLSLAGMNGGAGKRIGWATKLVESVSVPVSTLSPVIFSFLTKSFSYHMQKISYEVLHMCWLIG